MKTERQDLALKNIKTNFLLEKKETSHDADEILFFTFLHFFDAIDDSSHRLAEENRFHGPFSKLITISTFFYFKKEKKSNIRF